MHGIGDTVVVTPIGFLGGEPETTYTPRGKAVATLSLATKTSWTKDDEREERTEEEDEITDEVDGEESHDAGMCMRNAGVSWWLVVSSW